MDHKIFGGFKITLYVVGTDSGGFLGNEVEFAAALIIGHGFDLAYGEFVAREILAFIDCKVNVRVVAVDGELEAALFGVIFGGKAVSAGEKLQAFFFCEVNKLEFGDAVIIYDLSRGLIAFINRGDIAGGGSGLAVKGTSKY